MGKEKARRLPPDHGVSLASATPGPCVLELGEPRCNFVPLVDYSCLKMDLEVEGQSPPGRTALSLPRPGELDLRKW